MSPCRSRAHRRSIRAVFLAMAVFIAGLLVFIVLTGIYVFGGPTHRANALASVWWMLGAAAIFLAAAAVEGITARRERKQLDQEQR